MELHQAQKQIANDRHRFRVVNCGRRFGKSTLAAYEMLGFAYANDDARVPYYAPTRDDARDIMWGILQRIVGDAAVDKNEARLELLVRNRFSTTSLIALYGWESVQERRKGVGVKNNFIVLDEVASFRNFWPAWQEVLRPTLTDLKGDALFISTPKGFNHFYDLYNLENKDDDFKSFHFTTLDNPHIPKDEVEKARHELTEDRFAQEYLADFRKTEGLVYKEFVREKHLFGDDRIQGKSFVKLFGGVDFGTHNPAAAIEIREDRDGHYFVSEKLYKSGLTDSAVADFVAALNWNQCYPDPESASGVLELENRKVNVRPVIKSKDSVRNGINAVRELFRANRLFIHKDSINLIWELESYAYPDKRAEHNEQENPIKENDHALDALRYALCSAHFAKPQTVSIFTPSWQRYGRTSKVKINTPMPRR